MTVAARASLATPASFLFLPRALANGTFLGWFVRTWAGFGFPTLPAFLRFLAGFLARLGFLILRLDLRLRLQDWEVEVVPVAAPVFESFVLRFPQIHECCVVVSNVRKVQFLRR